MCAQLVQVNSSTQTKGDEGASTAGPGRKSCACPVRPGWDPTLIMSLYVIIILIRGQIWRDLILFLQDLQSNLCECQRLSRGDVVDYAPLTKLNEPFAATNTPRAHTTLTKEDEHVNLFCMHWEGSVHLLACKRAHQYSKPTRSSRTPSPRTCPLTSPPPWTPLR